MPIKLCVFDAYGTLFDVSAAARHAAQEPGGEALARHWPRLAEDWRRKQLEYTWLRSLMGRHADFRTVTAEALDWALEAAGLSGDLHPRLMALYDRLDAYPEVPGMLAALKARGLATAILSNGTPAMLAGAVGHAAIGGLLDDCLSVEAVGIFKPDPRVYALAPLRFGCTPAEVLFVSSNGWDVAGAGSFGFTTVWVNRAGLPQDRLPSRPDHMLPDLSGLPALLETP
ncbi:haloacid dehalogenase type II [Frigidibacter mobilis]|uniref:(S)-2-haloacid dehalogenase n=1 Tax=Frigidibacter mobilis TaxID=1335048 RepID=A0A161GW47_9RHOB|nr:haloacid dehalogenase type II [Frigidibacter mobilis]AMY68129.1 haloacid dehalogenase, type II [Frigidibacter mobilis]